MQLRVAPKVLVLKAKTYMRRLSWGYGIIIRSIVV